MKVVLITSEIGNYNSHQDVTASANEIMQQGAFANITVNWEVEYIFKLVHGFCIGIHNKRKTSVINQADVWKLYTVGIKSEKKLLQGFIV